MSETCKDGGAAFPAKWSDVHTPLGEPHNAGMTLRDWFAGQAMAAMIVGNNASAAVCGRDGSFGLSIDAYIVADAMLAERLKP